MYTLQKVPQWIQGASEVWDRKISETFVVLLDLLTQLSTQPTQGGFGIRVNVLPTFQIYD